MTSDEQWTIDYMKARISQDRLEYARLFKCMWRWLFAGIAAEVISAQSVAPTPHWLGLLLFWIAIFLVNISWMLCDRARVVAITLQGRTDFLAQIPGDIAYAMRVDAG